MPQQTIAPSKSKKLHSSMPQNWNFDAHGMTKRLTEVERNSLTSQEVRPEVVDVFVQTLNGKRGVFSLFKGLNLEETKRFPQMALQAFLRGLISENQFATYCLLYQAIDQFIDHPSAVRQLHLRTAEGKFEHRIDISPLKSFSDLFLDLFSIRHINLDKDQEDADRILKTFLNISDEQFETLKELILKEPCSEHYFYTFKIPVGDVHSWSPMYKGILNPMHIWYPVNDTKDPPPFLFSDWRQKVFVLPSFSMLQAYLCAFHLEHAIKMKPFMGKCTTKVIEEYWLRHERVINVAMPGVAVPPVGDGHYGGLFMFSWHDVYHALRISVQKKNEREALHYIILNLFDPILKQFPDRADIKKMRWMLIDGEFHNSVEVGDPFGEVFSYGMGRWTPDLKMLVIKDMVHHSVLWKERFNLDRKDLLPPEQSIYDSIQNP